MAKIAILGWGSLLWDKRPEFDDYHDDWQSNGPNLKLEFSRVSKSRGGALTLVIDPDSGQECQVAWSLSRRKRLEDAIADLRCREGTIVRRIGFVGLQENSKYGNDQSSMDLIREWAKSNKLAYVVWTDLPSNFQEICGSEFSITAACNHLENLTPEAKAHAVEYVWRAPDFVKTPLRDALQAEPWFQTR